jgi:hypothetical protein
MEMIWIQIGITILIIIFALGINLFLIHMIVDLFDCFNWDFGDWGLVFLWLFMFLSLNTCFIFLLNLTWGWIPL